MTFKSTKVVIVASEFNSKVTEGLLNGALDVFYKNGGDRDLLDVIKVPGAFDIPSAAVKAIEKISPDAVITLGAVIKGETKHFEYISDNCSRAIMDLSCTAFRATAGLPWETLWAHPTYRNRWFGSSAISGERFQRSPWRTG